MTNPDDTGNAVADRVQLHLVLPYKFDPVDDGRIRAYLDRGYHIEQLQRLTDREALVTMARDEAVG